MIRKVIFIFLSIIIITGSVYAEGIRDGVYKKTITAGWSVAHAIKQDGSIIGWGATTYNRISGIPAGNDYVQVVTLELASMALKADGSIVGWGNDSYNTISNIPTGNDFVQISGGNQHAIALRADGSIVSWGNNFSGAGVVTNTPTGNDFVQVAASRYHGSAAIKEDGSLVVWGFNNQGQIAGKPAGNDFVQIALGYAHYHALREDGSIASWAFDVDGPVSESPEGNDFVQITAGFKHAHAIKQDGTIVSWGWDSEGQVTDTPTGSGFIEINAGNEFVIALNQDGTITQWGKNIAGTPPGGPEFGEPVSVEDVTNVQKTVQGYTDITVTWEDPVDSDLVNVYLDDVYVGNTALEQYEFTGLDPATEYKITLENEFESEMAAGADVFYSTKIIQNVTGITTDFVTPTEISLTWTDAPDYDSYDIYLDGALLKNIIIPSTMITDLQPDLQYEIEIVTDIEGHKSSGIKYYETTADSPFIVTGLHVDYKTDEMIRIAYNEYQNAELYKIYVDDVYEGETSSLYYNITGLLQDTAYKIEITAVIGTWESDLSLPITVYTEASMEAILPQNVVLLDSGTAYLQVGWDNEPLNTFYEVMVDNEFYGSTNGDEITILNLDYGTEYLVAVRSVRQYNSWTYESDWVYNTFSTAEIPPGVTYLTLLQEKMYSIVIQWDYVPEATKYRIYVNNKLHSIHEHDDPNQLEIDVRPGWDYSIYATLFTAGVTESEKSNTLYINLDIPIHDVETEEMLARAVDIFKGSWPMIAILMGLVIAAKIVQVITKYLQRV